MSTMALAFSGLIKVALDRLQLGYFDLELVHYRVLYGLLFRMASGPIYDLRYKCHMIFLCFRL